MDTLESINSFLSQPCIAVVGVSRTKTKFGNTVYRTLKKKGIKVIPVNPHLTSFDGDTCYSDIETLPADIDTLFVNTPPDKTLSILKSAVHKGFKHFWLQQGASDETVISYISQQQVHYIADRCIMMFAEPVGSFHKFHRFFARMSESFPK